MRVYVGGCGMRSRDVEWPGRKKRSHSSLPLALICHVLWSKSYSMASSSFWNAAYFVMKSDLLWLLVITLMTCWETLCDLVFVWLFSASSKHHPPRKSQTSSARAALSSESPPHAFCPGQLRKNHPKKPLQTTHTRARGSHALSSWGPCASWSY